MIDAFIHFHDSLWLPVKLLVDFLFSTIVIRGILANEIMQEIKQRGWLKEGILHNMIKHIKAWNFVARKVAISEHYRHGHVHDDVVGCAQGNCAIFAESTYTRPATA